MIINYNFNIQRLSLFLVVFNIFILFKELPMAITGFALSTLVIPYLIKNKKVRSLLKPTLLFVGLFLLKYVFKTFLVLEVDVAFVMILASLKLWELEDIDDHFNMFLILALFESCLFLINPTFITFFLGLLKIVVFFYYILKIRNYDLSLLNGKRLLFLIAPSILLSLLLFYTFPRFTQGFLNSSNNQLLFSGNNSDLNFKKLGPLSLSSKIVFRVYGLNQEQFPLPHLYWRESILWDYFKEEWRTAYLNLKAEELEVKKPFVNYQIKLLKDYNEFLPTLDGNSHLVKSNHDFTYYSEGSFRLKNISRTNILYDVNTGYQKLIKTFLPIMERKGLRLKSKNKEEILQLILQNKALSTLSESDKLNLAIDFFKSRSFEYSLSPPAYLDVEDFILHGKKGYCSHFAASFAYITRVLGLPGRIISGYQGGEYNSFDKSLIIRELDAHAWVEVYQSKIGWIKVDPTAFVSPERIKLGASGFNEKLEPFINLYYYQLPKSFIKFATLNHFSQWMDSLDTLFNSSIFNFDKDRQQQLLNSYLPKSFSLGWLFVISLCGSMPLFWLLLTWASRKKLDPDFKRYQLFLKEMESLGLIKDEHETLTHFKNRCLAHVDFNSKYYQYILIETDFYIGKFYK